MKKLIESGLPLKEINEQSAREKSIRHGHPSTMHLWWARRPLASARAVLFSMLIDDPKSEEDRIRLEDLLKRLSNWDNLNDQRLFDDARSEIKKIFGDNLPTVLDPFAGGGAIPLEAQRLGLPVVATDLNPVAILINRAMLDIPSKFRNQPPQHPRDILLEDRSPGSLGLAEDVRYYGNRLKDLAWNRIGEHYPRIDGKLVVAWIWARTVQCSNPACRCQMPLVHSWKLSDDRFVHAEKIGDEIQFEVRNGKSKSEGTIDRNGARCIVCGNQVKLDYVRSEARCGRMGSRMIAIVANGENGKEYLSPREDQIRAAEIPRVEDPFDDAELPEKALGFRVQGYGMKKWSDLYSNRQLLALTTFSDLLDEIEDEVRRDSNSEDYAKAIRVYLAILIDRLATFGSMMCSWLAARELIAQIFTLQAVKMNWEFAESNVFSESTGSLEILLGQMCEAIEKFPDVKTQSETHLVDANDLAKYFKDRRFMICTDPPYYDNVGFADLSDFFYVWLRKNLRNVYPDLFRRSLTPKDDEIIMNPARHGGDKNVAREFFESRLKSVFKKFFEIGRDDLPLSIFYAFKQKKVTRDEENSGWETMLQSLIDAKLKIIGTIPIKTERTARPRANESNALSTSIVLVCRKRLDNRSTDRDSFLRELKSKLQSAVKEFQALSFSSIDLAQAVIGPGMEVYSKYAEIIYGEDDSILDVRGALKDISETLDSILDSRSYDSVTAFCLELFKDHRFAFVNYGDADLLARSKNINIEELNDVTYSDGGMICLKDRDELPIDKPMSNLWLQIQQMIHAMEVRGNQGCINLLSQIEESNWDRIQKLLYRLSFTKQLSAEESVKYNDVISSWDTIVKESKNRNDQKSIQTSLKGMDS